MELGSRPRRGEHVVWRRGEDGLVLLNPLDGTYFTLDDTGGRIWELCDGERSVADIAVALGGEYDAAVPEIESDALELVSGLEQEGLLAGSDRP